METLDEKDRLQMPVWRTFRCYASVVRNRPYLMMNLFKDSPRWSTFVLMAMAVLSLSALLLAWPFAMFEVFIFLMLFCVGLLTPATITLALCTITENRGMAAALLGAVPFLLGKNPQFSTIVLSAP
ncbi:MAG: hypothetical protein NC113_07000 [Bacteroides sp.]|nr:hypothetical protein [Bacteroides sp.]MCM1447954.1 hypothetical protein [Bacteroides sp.]